MGHPTQLAKELPDMLPGIIVHEWVYGLFNTSLAGQPSGIKGLLAATEKEIVFYAKNGSEPIISFSCKYKEILSIDADLETPARITCFVDGDSHFELSLISRGDAQAFMRHVTVHGYIPQKHTS
ncbi:hypothetical protein [Planomicrobium sp. YIM 101495]|uniref:hypothetical protein n=1 Tax=Planomicrobium sp. YIM 101495 TaxID=2665160 RepID=UPI0012BA35CD|nr:hypothetical protein [Planomicrobium sp. YIM 101495]MTD31314.1 hypothetical protein [Planomicrobium sp. YIM 101495]